ncbi:hypothetical protein AGMMS49960_21690 [Betaproteobacteria bacterium]|nr:hypothetical protein AGMMS49960_21690 [Betaproteobacteria bacterium]
MNELNLIFMKEAGSILNIVDMIPSYTERVGDELQHRTNILKSFVEKVDDFGVELALSRYNDDVKVRELLSDMDKVISSVENYE